MRDTKPTQPSDAPPMAVEAQEPAGAALHDAEFKPEEHGGFPRGSEVIRGPGRGASPETWTFYIQVPPTRGMLPHDWQQLRESLSQHGWSLQQVSGFVPAPYVKRDPEEPRSSKRGDGGLVLELGPLWAQRLAQLAKHANADQDPAAHVLELVKRQWVTSPFSKGSPR